MEKEENLTLLYYKFGVSLEECYSKLLINASFFKYETLTLMVKVKMAKSAKEEATTVQRVCRSIALLLL